MDRKEPSLFGTDLEDKPKNDKKNLKKQVKDEVNIKDKAKQSLVELSENTSTTEASKNASFELQKASGASKNTENKQDSKKNLKNPFVKEADLNSSFDTDFKNQNPFDASSTAQFSSKNSHKSSGLFAVYLLIGIIFIALISLAFWQWGLIQKSNSQIETLTKTLEQVAKDISFIDESGDKKAISLQDSLNKLNKNVASLNTALKRQRTNSANNAAKINSVNKSLASDINKANEQIKDLSKSLANAKTALDSSISGLNSQLSSLKNTDVSLAKQIRGIANNVGEVSVVADALTNKLNKINMRDIQNLSSAKGQIEQELRSLKITTNRLTRQVEALLKANK